MGVMLRLRATARTYIDRLDVAGFQDSSRVQSRNSSPDVVVDGQQASIRSGLCPLVNLNRIWVFELVRVAYS